MAQNLVPNPGFENYINCPIHTGQVECPLIPGIAPTTASNWLSPTPTTPDYYNACAQNIHISVPDNFYGHFPAHQGNAYMGIFVATLTISDPPAYNYEYLQCKLISPLVAGMTYDVSCYVKHMIRRDESAQNRMAVKNIGVIFTDTMIARHGTTLPFTGIEMTKAGSGFITDTSGWVKISAIYTARGGEQYMTIGGLYGGNLPPWTLVYPTQPHAVVEYISYYSIDDVAVVSQQKCDTIMYNHDTTICDSNALPLTLKSSSDTATGYAWASAENTRTIKARTSGEYMCIASKGCNAVIDHFRIRYMPAGMLASITTRLKDSTFCKGAAFILGRQYDYPLNYKWNTGEDSCCISVNNPGRYILSVSTTCDTVTDTADINGADCKNCIFVPDAFTPNNDGLNDNFGAIALCGIKSFSMRIYNRWGQQVFYTDNIHRRWNGMHAADVAGIGAYYYYIQYTTAHDNNTMLKKGDITLLR